MDYGLYSDYTTKQLYMIILCIIYMIITYDYYHAIVLYIWLLLWIIIAYYSKNFLYLKSIRRRPDFSSKAEALAGDAMSLFSGGCFPSAATTGDWVKRYHGGPQIWSIDLEDLWSSCEDLFRDQGPRRISCWNIWMEDTTSWCHWYSKEEGIIDTWPW